MAEVKEGIGTLLVFVLVIDKDFARFAYCQVRDRIFSLRTFAANKALLRSREWFNVEVLILA